MEADTPENILWNELKRGSTIALGKLYDLFIDELFLYGCKISSEENIVQDCIHDVFVDLYKYRKKLSDNPNVKFYLLRSLKNKILKSPEFQKSGYQKIYTANSEALSSEVESVEELFINEEIFKEKSQRVLQALNLLPKRQKQGILLKFVHNKNYQEIAEIMQVNIDTSRTIVYRGLKTLRKNLLTIFWLLLHIWQYENIVDY